MNWTIIILSALFFYALYQLDKRFKRLEEERGLGYSYSFVVNARDAVIYHPKFLKESKIKSAVAGNPYKNWSESEKNAFGDFIDKHLGNKAWVRINYLTSENGFLVEANGRSYFIFRGIGSTSIYNEMIIGDENSIFQDSLEFGLKVKIQKDIDGNYRHFLIGYLEERFKDLDKKSKATVLFEYPYNSVNLDDDYFKKLGFEVKREGGDDVYEDEVGEMQAIPTVITYKKSRAEVRIVV